MLRGEVGVGRHLDLTVGNLGLDLAHSTRLSQHAPLVLPDLLVVDSLDHGR